MMPAIKPNQLPRVLLIEDERLLQIIHKRTLELFGFEVIVVDHPQKAINLWTEHWDLILSDIGLPEIPGTDLCKLRRQYEEKYFLPRTPSLAYSAFGNTIQDECLAAGFDGFGVKPMENSELWDALQALLPKFKLIPFKKFS